MELKNRCFGTGKPLYEAYHDQEWGVPVHDDRHLFEMLLLEGAQAGLSWEIILNRREAYRRLFFNFEPQAVAMMSDSQLEQILLNPAIIRNRRKVFAARQNAQAYLKIQEEFGSFDRYIWKFVANRPVVNRWGSSKELPCQTKESLTISKDLKKRGMVFVGPKIIYSFMQAVGMVNDHLASCWLNN
jgi:DNA-3-methyladenine glycosylase I